MPNKPTFEIGLVMAGAVSAGAYTAGALDFLIEALDAWEEGKRQQDPDAPPHDVKLKVMAGASAGGMCAAIAAVALDREFSPVRDGDRGPATNPFYRSWVKDIDIAALLDTSDLKKADAPVQSLLNSDKLPAIVTSVLAIGGAAKPRPYVDDPLAVRFSVGNLRGIPYAIAMRGNTAAGHAMQVHGDDVSFSVQAAGTRQVPPDWTVLKRPNSATDAKWTALGDAALASGAFPLFLRARRLSRKSHADLNQREFVIPGDGTDDPVTGATRLVPIEPRWPDLDPSTPYAFLSVDGGIIDNEPLELAHEVLAGGRLARNPRSGKRADRALLMIDPFVDDVAMGPSEELPVGSLLGPLTDAWKMQCRFKPADLALAHDDHVYSRFLLAPSRGDAAPATRHPCAAGGLGGFLGFFHEAFRHHDYMLGRRNCQRFLRRHFILPRDNKLFAQWPEALKARQEIADEDGPHLPIIPLFGDCDAREEPIPNWPAGRLDPETLRPAIKRRADAVVRRLSSDLGWWARQYVRFGWRASGSGMMVDEAMGAVKKALEDQRL